MMRYFYYYISLVVLMIFRPQLIVKDCSTNAQYRERNFIYLWGKTYNYDDSGYLMVLAFKYLW